MSAGTVGRAEKFAVAGSIAYDHLSHFPGRFADNLMADQLDRLSVSFLVDGLTVRRGGVGANIAFAMGVLGHRPVLVGAVGGDFAEYRTWLEKHGVDCSGVLTIEDDHCARFSCTTDDDQCQIASFYPGAMNRSGDIDLGPLTLMRGVSTVLVGASAPDAMVSQTAQAHRLGLAVAADPSQQLPRLDRSACRELIDGARYLFTNEYEFELLIHKSGWTTDEIDRRVTTRVTTRAAKGSVIVYDGRRIEIAAVPVDRIVDPTGAGDAFRSGFLVGVANGLDLAESAQLGSIVASVVLESSGAQEWTIDMIAPERLIETYGPAQSQSAVRVLDAAVAMAHPRR